MYDKAKAERWIEKAYADPCGIIPPQFKVEPGHPPQPGGLSVTERGAEGRYLNLIRVRLADSFDLSILEACHNHQRGVEPHIAKVADELSKACKLRPDISVNIVMYWSGRIRLDFSEWAELTGKKISTLTRYNQNGKKQLNEWYAAAVRAAWCDK
jgi:hypothetical protein